MKYFDYKIDNKKADEMLQNVFRATGQAPNTVPFDKLLLRQKAKIGNLMTARVIAITALVLIVLCPVFFRPALKDVHGPEIAGDSLEQDVLSITVTDKDTGVFFEGIYAKDDDGSIVKPSSFDKDKSVVKFEHPEKSLNIYIPDNAGNVTHALFTEK